MEAIEAIKTRRSVRAYQNRPVPRDILADLVDCARLAPSAMNGQQWEFVVITRPATFEALAKHISHSQWLAKAPAAIAVFCRPHMLYVEDGSAAMQNILLGATGHGLGSCWVSVDKQPYAEACARLLGAPADYRLVGLAVVGYSAESPMREKRPLESVMHWETF